MKQIFCDWIKMWRVTLRIYHYIIWHSQVLLGNALKIDTKSDWSVLNVEVSTPWQVPLHIPGLANLILSSTMSFSLCPQLCEVISAAAPRRVQVGSPWPCYVWCLPHSQTQGYFHSAPLRLERCLERMFLLWMRENGNILQSKTNKQTGRCSWVCIYYFLYIYASQKRFIQGSAML